MRVAGDAMLVNTSVPNVGGVEALLVTSDKRTQPLNAYSPIEVTPSGMLIEVREEQSKKAYEPIEVTASGMFIETSAEQSRKAEPPI